MARYRYVYTDFWNDPKVIEEMTPEDKYFFLYLLTNPNTKQIGIYEITKKQIAFDMGYSLESVNSLFDRFINHHKLIKYNEKTRELAIKNWGRFNLVRGGKPILDCVTSELEDVKDRELIQYVAGAIENELIKALFIGAFGGQSDTCNGTVDDTPTIRVQKEKEKEKEKEDLLYETVINLYHSICVSLPKIIKLNTNRKTIIRSRYKDHGMDGLETLFKKAEASDFLSGRSGKWTSCNFDWLMKDSNCLKVLEGNYDNRDKQHEQSSRNDGKGVSRDIRGVSQDRGSSKWDHLYD